MRQVGIVGTFDVENYGDLLFPLVAEFELQRRLGEVTVRPFSYRAKSRSSWPFDVDSVADLPEAMSELDALLIGGGFLVRFDKDVAAGYAPPPNVHHPTGYWLTPALLAHAQGVPVIWNGPGMHLNEVPAWARPLLTLSLELSSRIAVRDEPSRAALAAFVAGRTIEVIPDTAFAISRLVGDAPPSADPYVVIQPAKWMADFPAFVKRHAARFGKHRLLAVPIGPILGDDAGFIADLPGIETLPSWPAPLELARIISNAEAVVGHSYHLAITAAMAGVPVFTSVDLDAGKFTALRGLDNVYRLADVRLSDPDWFFARVGRKTVPASAAAKLSELAHHWDAVANIVAAGKVATEPAVGRFLQWLPALLEAGNDR